MRNLKKALFLFLLTLLTLTTLNFKSYAATFKSDNNNGEFTPNNTITTNVMGLEHLSVYGVGNSSSKQHINVLSMKTDRYSSKLVTWAIDNGKNYQRSTLVELAKDYEKNHPGWLVVGGINADQYTTGFGSSVGDGTSYFYPQTYYPLIMDNEGRIPKTVQGSTSQQVGFKNDESVDSFAYASDIDHYIVDIVDQYGNSINNYKIDNINTAPTAGQTTVWSTYISMSKSGTYITKELSSNNEIFIVEKPELAYMSSCKEYKNGDANYDIMFGRGTISKIANSHLLINNQFAIESTNADLNNDLSIGKRIVVKAIYKNAELNSCEASTGYHSVHRLNNQDQALVHTSYDGNRYSRAIVGKKADGTYVLLTVDLGTDPNDLMVRYQGMGFDECNATLKAYGVVEAYQMDGGGSVTSILRNKDGGFDVTNFPRDGIRANMTGLLYVVRDPGIYQNQDNTTYHSVELNINDFKGINSTINNVTVKFNENDYTFKDGKITIDGLKDNTEYNLEYTYDVCENESTDKKEKLSSSIKVKTKLFTDFNPGFEVGEISKNSIIFTRSEDVNIKNVKIHLGDEIIQMNDNYQVTAYDLLSDSEYHIEYHFDVYDPVTEQTYQRVLDGGNVKTLNYNKPKIIKFETVREYTDKIILSYTYIDEDKKATKVYIEYDNKQVVINSLSGSVRIEDLDFTSNIYNFVLVINYQVDNSSPESYVRSSVITKGSEIIKHQIIYNLDGGTNEEGAPIEYSEKVGLNVLPTPTKEGYTFLGWYIGETKVTSISTSETTDVTLTAKWEKQEVKHQITYNLDGGVIQNAPNEYVEGTGLNTLVTPTKEGYTFLGWYIGETKVTSISTSETTDVTLTAKWEEVQKEVETTSTPKKGCSCKKDVIYLIEFSMMLSLLVIVLKKKH